MRQQRRAAACRGIDLEKPGTGTDAGPNYFVAVGNESSVRAGGNASARVRQAVGACQGAAS